MTKEQYDYERHEWIPPAWAAGEGVEDELIASTNLKSRDETVKLYIRQRPPISVTIPPKYEYQMGGPGRYDWQTSRYAKEGSEPRPGKRKVPPEYYREITNIAGTIVKSKNRMRLEEAYSEWLSADNKVPFEWAFPGHPELLKLDLQNPRPTNDKVAERFGKGNEAEGVCMSSDGDKLYSYSTIIMQRLPGGEVIYNATPYSQTTYKHQGAARRAVTPDHIVYGIPYGAQDLRDYLKTKKVIATSQVKQERVDLVMMEYHSYGGGMVYYLERYTPDFIHSTELTVPQAYMEYRDADSTRSGRPLVPFAQAFPDVDNAELQRIIKRYGYAPMVNPAVGKRRWHYPFNKWHQSGTQLLAQSIVQTKLGQLGVNLYRTRTGRYLRESGYDLGGQFGESVGPADISYISRKDALLDYRDADVKVVPESEAFR